MATFVIPTKAKKTCESLPDLETFTDEEKELIRTTRETLLAEIEKAIASTGKKMHYSVTGQYFDDRTERTLDYWKESNPAIAYAVDEICQELRQKKWHPWITHSTRSLWNGIYSGGLQLHVKCDFK